MSEIWNSCLAINSALFAVASTYLILSLGLSIYLLSWVPVVIGVALFLFLICTEVLFAVLE